MRAWSLPDAHGLNILRSRLALGFLYFKSFYCRLVPKNGRDEGEGVEFCEMNWIGIGRIAKAYLYSIGIWSALSLLTGWNYLIFDQNANLRSNLTDMMLLAEGRGLSYALLTPPVFYLVQRYTSGGGLRVRYLIGYILGAFPFLVLDACIRWVICPPWNPTLGSFVSRSSSSPLDFIRSGFADLISMYLATLLAAHAYSYLERVRKQDLERSEYQHALATSELQALKMQIHPHFLFNTLHGISTLIDSDGKSAQSMILKLSNLLRTSLDHSGSDLIPLQDELKFIREYLDIEQMRFGSRLSVTWTLDPETLRSLVPQLILQPLVENAIRHGIACSRGSGWVEIESQASDRGLELRIRNSTGGVRPKGAGVGLRNTKARLKYLYAEEASFSFVVDTEQTATAMLVLPSLGSQMQTLGDVELLDSSGSKGGGYARTDHG
jgi:two-component system, LytTR family, sensor kinase